MTAATSQPGTRPMKRAAPARPGCLAPTCPEDLAWPSVFAPTTWVPAASDVLIARTGAVSSAPGVVACSAFRAPPIAANLHLLAPAGPRSTEGGAGNDTG